LSMGFRTLGFWTSRHPAIQTTGLLTFALAGLSPAEHTSLYRSQLPYGGFSPVRLQGWRIRRDLPKASGSLSLLPACTVLRLVCRRPSCFSIDPLKVGSVDAIYCTATRWIAPPTPGALARNRVIVSTIRHHLIGPIRPTRRHPTTSPHCGLYAGPSLCGSA
jgi:hypothetical protein